MELTRFEALRRFEVALIRFIFKQITKGLLDRFGADRVIDTPITSVSFAIRSRLALTEVVFTERLVSPVLQ